MNRARIVVLAIAAGAGLTALYLASGSDNSAPPAPVAQLPTMNILVAKSDIGLGQSVNPDDSNKRGETVNVIRYGVADQATLQKWPKGRTI